MKNRSTKEKAMIATDKAVKEDRLNIDDLVELINQKGDYLNAMTCAEYAKRENISVQAAAKSKHCKIILGRKFVCDNE